MNEQVETLESSAPRPAVEGAVEKDSMPAGGAAVETCGVAPAVALPADADTGTASSAAPTLEEIAAATREAVSQAMAAANLAPETARGLRDLEQLSGQIARLPNLLRGGLESSFSVLLERIEDPKGVLAFNRQRRLFLDLLSLYDMMGELERNAECDAQHRGNYMTLREQLAQTLSMNEVLPIPAQVGTPFSPQQHRAVQIASTTDASHDGRIETIVREGFSFGAFVLRPAEVVVGKLAVSPRVAEPPTVTPADTAASAAANGGGDSNQPV